MTSSLCHYDAGLFLSIQKSTLCCGRAHPAAQEVGIQPLHQSWGPAAAGVPQPLLSMTSASTKLSPSTAENNYFSENQDVPSSSSFWNLSHWISLWSPCLQDIHYCQDQGWALKTWVLSRLLSWGVCHPSITKTKKRRETIYECYSRTLSNPRHLAVLHYRATEGNTTLRQTLRADLSTAELGYWNQTGISLQTVDAKTLSHCAAQCLCITTYLKGLKQSQHNFGLLHICFPQRKGFHLSPRHTAFCIYFGSLSCELWYDLSTRQYFTSSQINRTELQAARHAAEERWAASPTVQPGSLGRQQGTRSWWAGSHLALECICFRANKYTSLPFARIAPEHEAFDYSCLDKEAESFPVHTDIQDVCTWEMPLCQHFLQCLQQWDMHTFEGQL